MKRNRHRLSRFVSARTFWVRAVHAWRELLPDWQPTLQELQALDNMPANHQRAVRVVAYGWGNNDPRWDVLMALLEWERRAERDRLIRAEAWTEMAERVAQCALYEDPEEESDVDDPLGLYEDRMACDTEREVPILREVHPSEEDVHGDGEPVQQGPGDGEAEDGDPDPDERAAEGASLVRRPARVLSLREARAYKAGGGDE